MREVIKSIMHSKGGHEIITRDKCRIRWIKHVPPTQHAIWLEVRIPTLVVREGAGVAAWRRKGGIAVIWRNHYKRHAHSKIWISIIFHYRALLVTSLHFRYEWLPVMSQFTEVFNPLERLSHLTVRSQFRGWLKPQSAFRRSIAIRNLSGSSSRAQVYLRIRRTWGIESPWNWNFFSFDSTEKSRRWSHTPLLKYRRYQYLGDWLLLHSQALVQILRHPPSRSKRIPLLWVENLMKMRIWDRFRRLI